MKLDLNLNTLIGGLALAGILWLVATTTRTEKSVALNQQATASHERDILDLRGRMILVEIELSRLKATRP